MTTPPVQNPTEDAETLASDPRGLPLVHLAGIPIVDRTERQCVDHILAESCAQRGGWVITPNVDILRRIVREPDARALASEASMLVADGMPLVWASRLAGTPLAERVAGSSMIGSLSAAAAARGLSVYLVGGDPGAAEGAAGVLSRDNPELQVTVGPYLPLGFEQDPEIVALLHADVVRLRPDLVFVALGFPKQERVIRQLRALHPGAWYMGVGISFSYLTGDVRRAPRWMQRCGLEWLYRLKEEPLRLMKRYIVHDTPFAVALLAGALRQRFRRAGA